MLNIVLDPNTGKIVCDPSDASDFFFLSLAFDLGVAMFLLFAKNSNFFSIAWNESSFSSGSKIL